jgi:hypothetical protein
MNLEGGGKDSISSRHSWSHHKFYIKNYYRGCFGLGRDGGFRQTTEVLLYWLNGRLILRSLPHTKPTILSQIEFHYVRSGSEITLSPTSSQDLHKNFVESVDKLRVVPGAVLDDSLIPSIKYSHEPQGMALVYGS